MLKPAVWLALYVSLLLAATALLAWPAWWLLALFADADAPAFHKVAGKTFHAVAALSLVPLVYLSGAPAREVLGWGLAAGRFVRDLAAGFVLGSLMLAVLAAGLLLLGVREWSGSDMALGVLLVKALLAGLVIGLIEETFFRGAVFHRLRRSWPAAAAIGVSALFYGALHFIQAPPLGAGTVHWYSGFNLLGRAFNAFADPAIIDSLLALAAAGVLLGMVRERTGNIAMAAGMHAGWVAVIKLTRRYTETVPDAPLAFLAGSYDGVIGFLGAAWIIIVCLFAYAVFAGKRAVAVQLRALFIRGLIRLFSWLPLRLSHALGSFTGTLLAVLPNRVREITRINLALCFPLAGHGERLAMAGDSLRELGKGVCEIGKLWHEPPERLFARVCRVSGREAFDAACREGRGVIVAAPHLGAWELVGLYLGRHYGITSLYRPPRIGPLDGYIRAARQRSGATLVPTDATGVRQLHRTLRHGGVIGVLPDQQPKRGGGGFAAFFGLQAATMSLLSRLAARSGAAVFVVWAERLPAAGGYHLHFSPAPGVAGRDDMASIAALNRAIETAVRQCPAQYQWSYKRFETRPDGQPSIYREAVS